LRHQANMPQLALVDASEREMVDTQVALSPKRPYAETSGMADVFPYYAGFSYDWARTQLASLDLVPTSVVLDAWNGSGTTTLAAQSNGYRSIGVDLNPIANAVARLRVQLKQHDIPHMDPPGLICELDESDPLLAWFTQQTASRLRHWASALGDETTDSATLATVSLFRIVRRLTRQFEGSNPTWVRVAADESNLVDLDASVIDDLMTGEQAVIRERLQDQPAFDTASLIITASATNLPLAKNSVDAILTSPPYLTRIDYAVAYSRELAIMGVDVKRDRNLRSRLMGTTLIRNDTFDDGVKRYGKTARQLVKQVAGHPSKASKGYYLKQVRQYLDDLVNSLDELARVSKRGATMMLVVQDSYYKDIPIPLARICTEEAQLRGWTTDREPDTQEVKRHLTQMNTAARAYSKGSVYESVITMRRA
jgi:DNA modification methylase